MTSNDRWTQSTETIATMALTGAIAMGAGNRSATRAVLAALADAGLLATPSTSDSPSDAGATLGWEVLTRQNDGTWLADWDATTHATRESAEREAVSAASQERLIGRGVAYPARVARLISDGPIHEPAEVQQP